MFLTSTKDNDDDPASSSSSSSTKGTGIVMSEEMKDTVLVDMEQGQTSRRNDLDSSARSNNSDSSSTLSKKMPQVAKKRKLFASLIVLVGACASAAFLALGIVYRKQEQTVLFERRATDVTNRIEAAWAQYELFGLWIQESCFTPPGVDNTGDSELLHHRLNICSRERFRMLIQYVQSVGLNFQAASLFVNVTHTDRPDLEAESAAYYQEHYPPEVVDYKGMVGFLDDGEGGLMLGPQTEQPFYFPVHYMEPVEGNAAALDLDLYSHPARRKAIQDATETIKPVITERIRLAQETEDNAFSVLAFHPGVPLDIMNGQRPTVLSSMVIRIPDLIEAAAKKTSQGITVTIFDSTRDDILPVFMGGANIFVDGKKRETQVISTQERNLTDIKASAGRFEQRNLTIADKTWTIAITSNPGTFESNLVFVIFGGTVIFVISLLLGAWFYSSMGAMTKMQRLKEQAEHEKAAFILEAARKQAFSERQLNEYIAHEVRNPLGSAIAALSFVAAAIPQKEVVLKEERRKQMLDDVAIMDASLQFINDLLRNSLDMHKAVDNKLKITMAPTDIRKDVMEPIAAILHLRGSKVNLMIDCPDGLVVITDRMRVKQMVLNLANNSSKFVTQGFIRLKATIEQGRVLLFIEDSGPGIPLEKRASLFTKYQDSLDVLMQGTGLGLCLCKQLSVLIGGNIWVDETFDSGVEGFVGTRFVLDLGCGPMEDAHKLHRWESSPEEFVRNELTSFQKDQDRQEQALAAPTSAVSGDNQVLVLPEELSVLFVDDDLIIRRLFGRAVKRLAPEWKVAEASNGETACVMTKTDQYDIIFMDQYMASVEKQMLGTETVRALRNQGITTTICGLSANNTAEEFLEAGADTFLLKPFPCEREELRQELLRILKYRTTDQAGPCASPMFDHDSVSSALPQPLAAKGEPTTAAAASPSLSARDEPTTPAA